MKISHIIYRIEDLDKEIFRSKQMLYQDILDIVEYVFKATKEDYKFIQDLFYKYLKLLKNEPERIYWDITNRSKSKDLTVKFEIKTNWSGWNESVEVIVVPTEFIKLIQKEF